MKHTVNKKSAITNIVHDDFRIGEETANALLHGVGLGLSIAALVILIALASIGGDQLHIISVSVYGATLVILYSCSAVYHSLPPCRTKNIFQIFDHASIYLLIAGTYTPYTLITLKNTDVGWTMFALVWITALLGVAFTSSIIKRFVILSTVIYLVMGWLIVIAIKPLITNLPFNGLLFLIIGGLLYTLGTIFFIMRKMPYHHAVWHLFVLGGSIFHFLSILFFLTL